MTRRASSTTSRLSMRIVLLAMLGLAAVIPLIGLSVAFEASKGAGGDFIMFIVSIAILGISSVAVGVAILWRKPGNRIGVLLGVGGLVLMSVFTAWSIAMVQGESGHAVLIGLATWWGTIALLPAITLLFPGVGILFPDERLPTPRWRWPVAGGLVPLAIGVVLQTVAPWRTDGDFTGANPFAIPGLSTDAFDIGGGIAALGTFILFAIAVAAVIVRYRRSTGVEHAQQKWLVAGVAAMAIFFPLSFATDFGPADFIDLLSVAAGALVPIAVGIAVMRYHVFEIDRVVSRGIAYGLLTAVLAAIYAAVILVLQGPLGSVLGGDTVSIALSTLVVAALFQPLRRRFQRIVDNRFDRARVNADLIIAAFSERLRDEVDIGSVTADLDRTVREALKPAEIGLWLRNAEGTTP